MESEAPPLSHEHAAKLAHELLANVERVLRGKREVAIHYGILSPCCIDVRGQFTLLNALVLAFA